MQYMYAQTDSDYTVIVSRTMYLNNTLSIQMRVHVVKIK